MLNFLIPIVKANRRSHRTLANPGARLCRPRTAAAILKALRHQLHFMNQTRVCAFFVATFLLLPCLAQTAFAQLAPPGSPQDKAETPRRYLFIFDTSFAMRSRLPSTLKTLEHIISAASSNRFQPGDTIGVWTFDKEPHSSFPLTVWGDVDAAQLYDSIKTFLQIQRFTNTSHLESVLPAMSALIKNSESLNTILLYEGGGKMSGTPFDDSINTFFASRKKSSVRGGLPAVVILQSVRGIVVNHATAFYPTRVEIPPLPKIPAIEKPAVKAVPPTPLKVVAPVAPQKSLLPSPPPPAAIVPKAIEPPAKTVEPVLPAVQPLPITVETPQANLAPTNTAPLDPQKTTNQSVPQNTEPAVMPSPIANPVGEQKTIVTAPAPTPIIEKLPPAVTPAKQLETPTPIVATTAIASSNPVPSEVLPTVLPEEKGRSQSPFFLIAGILLAIVAAGLLMLIWMKSRKTSGSSYITRSMNERRK